METRQNNNLLIVGGSVKMKIGNDYVTGIIKTIDKSEQNQLFTKKKSIEIQLDNKNIVWAYAEDVISCMRPIKVKCPKCAKDGLQVMQPSTDRDMYKNGVKPHKNVQCEDCLSVFNIYVADNGVTNIIPQ